MGAWAYLYGHRIEWDGLQWVYADTREPIEDSKPRPCPRCGRLPTPEGDDACLGHMEDVTSACCGHGVEPAYWVSDRGIYYRTGICGGEYRPDAQAERTDRE